MPQLPGYWLSVQYTFYRLWWGVVNVARSRVMLRTGPDVPHHVGAVCTSQLLPTNLH